MLKRNILVGLAFSLLISQANAGALDDFEKAATKKKPKQSTEETDDRPPPRRGGSRGYYYGGGGYGGGYSSGGYTVDNSGNVYQRQCDVHHGLRFFGCPWRWVGYVSWYRVAPPSEHTEKWKPTPRQKGEWVLPFVRVELGHQSVENNSNLDALESLVEIGYGPFAVAHQQSYFREDVVDDPSTAEIESGKDTLRLSTTHLLFRISSNKHYEISAGLGQMRLSGNDVSSGFSAVIPFRLMNDNGWGFAGQLGWGSPEELTITNHQASVVYTRGSFSVHGGYRWFELEDSPLNLSGPLLKLGFHY